MNIFINLKLKNNLMMNLILIKELYQEKVLLELLNNVKVKLIINIMQLNELNKLILKKLKQDYKYKIKIILLINKIFIIDNIIK